VRNQGTAAAGSFTTTIYKSSVARASVPFAGLAPGTSATMNYVDGSSICDGLTWAAVADSSNVIPESNEGNNIRENFDEDPIC
jgi:subtilase family serine protease